MGGPNFIGAALADYQYDVFISYRRDYPVGPWVRDFLYERFVGWLSDSLGGRDARVFLDIEDIRVGLPWRLELQEALRTSRCLLAVWSPSYFRSRWCMSEWTSFRERERVASRLGLVLPILHNGRQHFPPEAAAIEMFDFSAYRSTMPGFIQTAMAVDFERKLEEFAGKVARAIAEAPPFQPNWPVVEVALDESVQPQVDLRRLIPAA